MYDRAKDNASAIIDEENEVTIEYCVDSDK